MNDPVISDYLKRIGSQGGKATAKSLTKKQRSALASKAAKARWKKRNSK